MIEKNADDTKFLAWLTIGMILASLFIFKSYLHYMLVAAVLALATSHVSSALINLLSRTKKVSFLNKNKKGITALLLTSFFLFMIFTPMLYFISMTYEQASSLDLAQIKQTLTEVIDKTTEILSKISFLQEPLAKIKAEGLSFISGPAVDAMLEGAKGFVLGAGSLIGQITWILLFYFLFIVYGQQILQFLARLMPMPYEHEKYLYSECTGTVAVVFYGTLFNMIAQGFSFGLLMLFIGDYDALYLGVLAGFCSVIPIVGAALIYVPIVGLELLDGNFVNCIIVLLFSWVFMGVFVDNVLRMIFIGYLKKRLGFQYTMNEILILLAMLAGIAAFGFWGLIIGPSVLALTLAAANLYSSSEENK